MYSWQHKKREKIIDLTILSKKKIKTMYILALYIFLLFRFWWEEATLITSISGIVVGMSIVVVVSRKSQHKHAILRIKSHAPSLCTCNNKTKQSIHQIYKYDSIIIPKVFKIFVFLPYYATSNIFWSYSANFIKKILIVKRIAYMIFIWQLFVIRYL